MILKEMVQTYLERFEGNYVEDLIIHEELQIVQSFSQSYWNCNVCDYDKFVSICRRFIGSESSGDTYQKRSIALSNFILWCLDRGYIRGNYDSFFQFSV